MSTPWFIFCCVAVVGAGASVALQQVLNANLRSQLQSPWWAGFVSYFLGAIIMLVAGLSTSPPHLSSTAFSAGYLISWTGGIFGAIFIATGIIMVPRLGTATMLALVVVGQMIASLMLDHFGLLGLAPHPVTPKRIVGAILLILGVVVIRG